MAENVLAFCFVILIVVTGSLSQTSTSIVNADGSVTTTTTTTNADGSTTTTTTTSTQTNVSTSGTTDFTSIVKSTSDQSLLSVATASFEKLLALETAKLNAITSGIKSVQGELSDLGKKIGPGFVSDFYLEGTSGLEATSTFLAGLNKYVSDLARSVYNQFPSEVSSAYLKCLKNTNQEANLASYLEFLKFRKDKLATAVGNFKTESVKCVQTNLTQKCLENAIKKVLPITLNRFNSTALLQATRGCLEAGAAAVKKLAAITMKSLRAVVPGSLLFTLPEQFDMENKTFLDVTPLVQPNVDLENVKALLAQANQETEEAVNGKAASLATVKAYLGPAMNASLALIDGTKVDPMCIMNAKTAVAANVDASAKQILKCIANVQTPPSTQQVLDLESALAAWEVRTNNLISESECAGKLRNAFDPKKLRCCITEAQTGFKLNVDLTVAEAESILKKSKNIKSWLNYCAVSGLTSFRNQLRNDLVALEKCAKQKSKEIIDFPIANPYATATATVGLSASV